MALEKDPLGRNAVLYWSTTQPADTQVATIETWLGSASEGGDVYDVNYPLTPEYADITTRRKAKTGFTARKPVIMDAEVSFDFSWEVHNASELLVQTLIDRTMSRAKLGLCFLDYAYDDSNLASGEFAQGLFGMFYVNIGKAEAVRDAQRGSCNVVGAELVHWFKHSAAP